MDDKAGRCIITSCPRLALHSTASSFLLKLIIEQIRYCGIFIGLRVKRSGWHLSNYDGLMIYKNLSPLLRAKKPATSQSQGEKNCRTRFSRSTRRHEKKRTGPSCFFLPQSLVSTCGRLLPPSPFLANVTLA